MKDLSKEARALLNSARRADSAPSALRERARRNFAHAVAAGTLSASAAVAKAASLGALGVAAPTGVSMAAGSSLAATLVSAVLTGVSLGAIALAPASSTHDVVAPTAVVQLAEPSSTKGVRQDRLRQVPIEANPLDTSAPPVATQAAPPMAHFRASPDENVREQGSRSAPSDIAQPTPPVAVPPLAPTAAFDAVTAPSKASIARETELLAEVQRALQQGRAASALSLLNRYSAEFPKGMLQEEAIASRVVVLCQLGSGGDAARWRAEFFRRYPSSPLSGRVRNACAAGGSSGKAEVQ